MATCNVNCLELPTRGVAGGWCAVWDDPDDSSQLRARAEAIERRQMRRAEILVTVWWAHIAAETPARSPQRPNLPA